MKEKKEQNKETLGLTIEQARQALRHLLAERQKVIEERNATPQWGEMSTTYNALNRELAEIEKKIDQARDWYNLGISECLYKESKRLSNLTVALIGVTVVLILATGIDILLKVIIHA